MFVDFDQVCGFRGVSQMNMSELSDKEVRDGIIIAISPHLKETKKPLYNAKDFIEVHHDVMKNYKGYKPEDFMKDSKLMSEVQRDFYDSASILYQKMDELDLQGGGVHWMRMNRYFNYDRKILKGKKSMLYIGMGNTRLARKFAMAGFDVWGTDISFEILKVGKTINDRIGILMHYVQHNAEEKFPFPDESFDCTYSNCTANHIVNWDNYFGEQFRVLKHGGILLCRMPNSDLKWFWDKQGELRESVEVKADHCNTDIANTMMFKLLGEHFSDIAYSEVWTHDRQYNIVPNNIAFRFMRKYTRPIWKAIAGFLYTIRTSFEDTIKNGNNRVDNKKGIYTMVLIAKV